MSRIALCFTVVVTMSGCLQFGDKIDEQTTKGSWIPLEEEDVTNFCNIQSDDGSGSQSAEIDEESMELTCTIDGENTVYSLDDVCTFCHCDDFCQSLPAQCYAIKNYLGELNCTCPKADPDYNQCRIPPVDPCEQFTGQQCYWMENTSGNYCWVPATWADDVSDCFALDSCDGGLGMSSGGCYKWADCSDCTREAWPAAGD